MKAIKHIGNYHNGVKNQISFQTTKNQILYYASKIKKNQQLAKIK